MKLHAPAPIGPGHRVAEFQSGRAAIDEWLQGAEPMRRDDRAGTFVVAGEDGRVAAFYTLASASVRGAVATGVPPIPVMKLGRIAVDRTLQGRGTGTALVLDAIARCNVVAEHTPVAALITDAPDTKSAAWMTRLGFRPVPGRAMTLVMSRDTIAALCRIGRG